MSTPIIPPAAASAPETPQPGAAKIVPIVPVPAPVTGVVEEVKEAIKPGEGEAEGKVDEFAAIIPEDILTLDTQKAMAELLGDTEISNTVLESYAYVDRLRDLTGIIPSPEDVNTLFQVNQEYSQFMSGLSGEEPQAALEMIMVAKDERGKLVITPEGQGIVAGLANLIPQLPPRYANAIAQATMGPVIDGLLKEATDLRASAEYIIGQRLAHRMKEGEEQQIQAAQMFSLVALLEQRFLGQESKPEDLLAGKRTVKEPSAQEIELDRQRKEFNKQQEAYRSERITEQNNQIYDYLQAPITAMINTFLINQDIGNGQTIGQFLGEDVVKQAAKELYEAASEAVNKKSPLVTVVSQLVNQYRKTGDKAVLDAAVKELEPAFRKAIKLEAPAIRNRLINTTVMAQQQSAQTRAVAATTHAATAPPTGPAKPVAPVSTPGRTQQTSSVEDWIRKK